MPEPSEGPNDTLSGSLQASDDAPAIVTSADTDVHLHLRCQHNACAPVSRLPVELLSLVLKLSINPSDDAQDATGFKRCNVISHVCHHWRAVSLSTPSLWSDFYIDIDAPYEMVETRLLRSKQAPLLFHIRWGRRDSLSLKLSRQCLLGRIFQELRRIEILHLNVLLIDFINLRWPQHSTSSLKSLELKESSYISGLPPNLEHEHHAFTNNLDARFPMLVRLTAKYFIFDFKQWRLPSTLTCLHIKDEATQPECDLTDILRAFQHLPLLEDLTLVHVVPSVVHLTPDMNLDPVPLHHLRSLTLCGHLISCVRVLDHLTYPPSGKLDLRFEMSPTNYNNYPSLSKYIPRDVRWSTVVFGLTEPNYPTIQGPGFSDPCIFAFRLWHDVKLASTDLCYEQADFHLSLLDSDGEIDLDDVTPIHTFLTELQFLAQITSLSVYYEDEWPKTAFHPSEAYNQMRTVEIFLIYGLRAMERLLQMLQEPGNSLFPNLREIHAHGIRFKNVHDAFKILLRKRQQEHPIGKLVLKFCHELSASYVDELMEIVDIEWDGDAHECEDSPSWQ